MVSIDNECDGQNLGVFGNLKEYMFLVATLWKVLPQVLIELRPQSVCFALKSPPEMNLLPNYRKYDCMFGNGFIWGTIC